MGRPPPPYGAPGRPHTTLRHCPLEGGRLSRKLPDFLNRAACGKIFADQPSGEYDRRGGVFPGSEATFCQVVCDGAAADAELKADGFVPAVGGAGVNGGERKHALGGEVVGLADGSGQRSISFMTRRRTFSGGRLAIFPSVAFIARNPCQDRRLAGPARLPRLYLLLRDG